jgi:hypothetical protein
MILVSMSSYVPNHLQNLRDLKAPMSVPILMVHGQKDGVIPIAEAHWGETNLNAQSYSHASGSDQYSAEVSVHKGISLLHSGY